MDKNTSRYWYASSEAVPLQTGMLRPSSSTSPAKQISALSRAMNSLLEPLRKCIDVGMEMALNEGKVRRCFSRAASCCCDTLTTKVMFSARHGAGEITVVQCALL